MNPSICFVSESLNNPPWSACNFFLDGLKELSGDKIVGVKHSESIPDGYDWYIDVDSARPKPALKTKLQNKKVCALIFDLFDPDCDQGWRYEMARCSDLVLVTNECSRKKIREAGIDTECKLITFGLNNKIWRHLDKEKTCDSAFVGNITRKTSKRRKIFIDNLKLSGYNITHRHGDCFMEEYVTLLNSSKIGLEIPNEEYDTFGIRTMEIVGCGLPLITIKDDTIEKILPPEFVTYYEPNCESLIEKYNMISCDYDKYKKNGFKLMDYFLEKFTYVKVAERIIKALNGEYVESEMFCS